MLLARACYRCDKHAALRGEEEKGVAMKRFTKEASNTLEGRESIRRALSRRQALGLLGGSLVGVSLLSSGLAAPAKALLSTACGLSWCITGPGGSPGETTNPVLSGTKVGSWWNLTLEWACVFAPELVNHKFGTNWTLMEDDSTSADDLITGTVAPHVQSATSGTATFIPSQHANPTAIEFTHTRTWHEDDLDTELGEEELYAVVRLKDFTLMTPSYIRNSLYLNISP
jgi:hypothetical protein